MSCAIGIATADRGLFDAVRQYLASAGLDGFDETTIEPDLLASAEQARDWLDPRDRALLVLDARLPDIAGGSQDHVRGDAARCLLEALRESGITTPVLVITPRQKLMPELDAICRPDRYAIALPLEQLRSHRGAILRPFVAMVMRRPAESTTIRVIEVDFCKDRSICKIGVGDGTNLLQWNVTTDLFFLKQTASQFSRREIFEQRDWADQVRSAGEVVFRPHVMDALGAGLFAHIERAAGGLTGLSFRYQVTDPALYPAPFEASVRTIDDDFSSRSGPFVLLSAPVVRRLAPLYVENVSGHTTAAIPSALRMLFVRSQMCEHAAGETTEDQLEISFPVSETTTNRKTFSFAKLGGIDDEFAALQELAARFPGLDLDQIDLSKTGNLSAPEALRAKFAGERYDIVHYAGHAWSSGLRPYDISLLILPGSDLGRACGMPVESLAELAGRAQARFVYLSACRGSSMRSVQSLVTHGVPHALGFRCDVEDVRATKFAKTFYAHLLAHRSLSAAFHAACKTARDSLESDEESPIWITPIMLAQTADWARRA